MKGITKMSENSHTSIPVRVHTRQHIANVTMALLERKTLDEISVKKIIEASHCSRATFYRYFKDKHDVVTWIYTSEVDRIVSKHHYTSEITLQIFRFMYERRKFFTRAFSYEQQNSLVDYMVSRSLEDCVGLLKKALNTNELSRDMMASVDFFVGGCLRIWHRWIADGMKDTPEFILRVIMDSMPESLRPYIK